MTDVAIEPGGVFKVTYGQDKTLDAHYLTFRQQQALRNFHKTVNEDDDQFEQCEAMLRLALPLWNDEEIEDLLANKINVQMVAGITLQVIRSGEVTEDDAKKLESQP